MRSQLSPNQRGALLMVLCMAMFGLNDMIVKLLGQGLALWEIIFVRGAVATIFLAALAAQQRIWVQVAVLRQGDFWLALLRTGLEAGATFFFLTALMVVPLATITAVLQVLPLSVTLAAAVFLGERVGWRRYTAIGVGFLGMLLIVRPSPAGLPTETVFALLAVLCLTARDIATRRMSDQFPSLLAALLAAAGVAVMGAVMGIGQGWQPPTQGQWLGLGLAGIFIPIAYLCAVAAMRHGDIGAVAPFRYTSLLWALLFGWLVFGDWPDGLTCLGAAILVLAGLFTLMRENRH